MQITVTGRKIEVTDALKDHAREKLEKVQKLFDFPLDVHIVLSVEKYRHEAEITINANGNVIRGKEETEDMYQSLDKVITKIERQLKRHKEKTWSIKRKTENKWTGVKTNIIDRESIVHENDEEPRIIKTKNFAVKPMSVKEAIMQIDMQGDDYMVFVNSSNSEVNVIYKRKDGNYEVVEPFYE